VDFARALEALRVCAAELVRNRHLFSNA